MINRDHACFLSATHAVRDSGIALSFGVEKGRYLPFAAATKTQFAGLVARGLGNIDKSGVPELVFPSHAKTTGNR